MPVQKGKWIDLMLDMCGASVIRIDLLWHLALSYMYNPMQNVYRKISGIALGHIPLF